VATVLSTISGTPWRWAISATAAMSVTLPSGLPMDSMKMALVRSSISGAKDRLARIGKAGLDAELRQRVGEQVVGAAIQGEAETMLSPASAMVWIA
jgi:hypothetical protein